MSKYIADGLHGDICRGVIKSYFLVMVAIYPFYAPGGYTNIGEIKFEFFRNVSLPTLAVAAVVILLSVVIRRDREWIIRNYRRMSVTDWLAFGYFVVILLSYLCSAYKKDALWGAEEWYMGAITQMIFILIYFLFSRYFHCDLRWIGVWLSAAAAVFLLGICNRYSLYPIAMTGQKVTFISTLGNINWFCGYWSVTAPIGITLYWCSDKMWVRTAAGIYSMIAMMSGITQGSESAYIVVAVVVLMLFVLSLGSNTRMYRFLELCMMFAGSCLLAKLMMYVPGLELNYITNTRSVSFNFTETLVLGNVAVWMLFITLGCYILLLLAGESGFLRIEDYWDKHVRLKGVVQATVVWITCIAAIILLVRSGVLNTHEASNVTKDDSYKMVFDEDWGTDRGFTWNCGINAYQNMNFLHKIVGVGPDCFADYIYSVPELADRLVDRFGNYRLTNAHNEQLTLLVNVGALGWLCYAGIFLTAFVRYMRRASLQPLLYLCFVSILTYAAHNIVSFQQVLNTPYIFIVLGIGENLYRSTTEGVYDCMSDKAGYMQK